MQVESFTVSGHAAFLRRRYVTRLKYARGVIGAVPLLDIVLLVLLYILLHSGLVLRPGMSLQLPTAEFIQGAPLGATLITVTSENLVFFDDRRVSMDQLPQSMNDARRVRETSTLFIQADRRAPHDTLLRIYAKASNAGFDEVVLATQLPGEAVADSP